MTGTFTLVSVCERLLIVWRGICSTNVEVGCVIVAIDSLLVNSGIVCGLPVVVGQWKMGVLEEQDSAVVGVSWPLLPL